MSDASGLGGFDPAWEARYREGRTAWERGGLNPAFLAWRESGALAPPGRVLVPGAGRSPEPRALAEAGFEVVALDAAPSAAAAQRAALAGRGEVVQADLFAWEPAAPFDLIYDQTCLCALPPEMLPAYEARLHAWLRPEGRLFVLLMQAGRPGGPPYDCPPEAMRALFAPARWAWPASLGAPVPHGIGFAEIPAVLRRRA